MIVGLQLQKFRAVNSPGNIDTFREWNDLVVAAVHHECRHPDLCRDIRKIGLTLLAHELRRLGRRRTFAAELVEPGQLLLGSLGQKHRRIETPEHRVRLAPTEFCQLGDGLSPARLLGGTPSPAAQVSPIDDEVRHIFRIFGSVLHCRAAALRNS